MKRILVAVDGSPVARRAVDFAAALGGEPELLLLNVIGTDDVAETDLREFARSEGLAGGSVELRRSFANWLLDDAREQARAAGAQHIRTAIAEGDPAEKVLAFARDNQVDLIVVGNRGRNRLTAALLGSVSRRVVSDASCPVTVVRE